MHAVALAAVGRAFPMPPSQQARWFAEQVQPCESALRAYLLRRFPSVPDHDDLLQETYVRTPFVVAAPGVSVRAVGTIFSVRVGAAGIEVLVVQGRVEVAPDDAPAARRRNR